MKSVPKDTRGAIVELLKNNKGMTAGEIAKELDLHSMTVRQHLSILEHQGYIQHYREKISRGRPVYIYKLTRQAKENLFPNDYPRFALGTLDALLVIDGAEKVNQLLEYQMEAKIAECLIDIEGKSLSEKVKVLAAFLDGEGYQVEIAETPNAYILKEHNCALESIAKKYPQLCQLELSLLQRLLEVPVERECHMPTGDSVCSYKVLKTDAAQELRE
jgi:DeoR family suf operon transcriptional repressor